MFGKFMAIGLTVVPIPVLGLAIQAIMKIILDPNKSFGEGIGLMLLFASLIVLMGMIVLGVHGIKWEFFEQKNDTDKIGGKQNVT